MRETEGVDSLKRIQIYNVTRFFSSKRCSELQEIQLYHCEIPEETMKALAMKACSTLERITVYGGKATQINSMLGMCEHVKVVSFEQNAMGVLNESRTIKIAVIAGMKGVIDLTIKCSDETILKIIIQSCLDLIRLHLGDLDQIKRIQHLIPSHIQLI